MATWEQAVLMTYYSVLIVLSIYGLHRYLLVYLYYRHRNRAHRLHGGFDDLPKVTVQLPLFNEAAVVRRLLDAVCAIDYPRDRLDIQVLDDSDDETVAIARALVAEKRQQGHAIHHLHRADRTGFKAGALADGLRRSDAEFVAIFDADFVPPPTILRDTIDHFTNPTIGMVQTRWGHTNRRFSLLTRIQSIFLDGHFVIEHTARNRSGRFFNFNGTAGIWRRSCIDDAGGWQHDTLTEDLDLSYRAQLQGWNFIFLPDVVSPGELPVEMNSFKTQQHRWAKGSIQVCRKLLPKVWSSRSSLKAKLEATFHLTSNFAYPLMVLMALLMLPALLARIADDSTVRGILFDLSLFMAASASVLSFYAASQREAYSDWTGSFRFFPMLLALGIGISVNNTRAVLEALFRHDSPFVRTPKYDVTETRAPGVLYRYVSSRQGLPLFEVGLALYFTLILGIAVAHGLVVTSIFLSLFAVGYYWVGIASLLGPLRRPATASS